jgi:hypothetical protein
VKSPNAAPAVSVPAASIYAPNSVKAFDAVSLKGSIRASAIAENQNFAVDVVGL